MRHPSIRHHQPSIASRVARGAFVLLAPTVAFAASADPGEHTARTIHGSGISDAPNSITQQLDRMRVGVALNRRLIEFEKKTNLRFGLANTMLFQQASAGPGERTVASGDLDLFLRWTAIGAGTPETGTLYFSTEYRYQIGDGTPADLGRTIGTLIPTVDGFGERPFVAKELYWDHRVAEGKFRYGIGRIDPGNLFGSHRLQSANSYFLNKAFSGTPATDNPGPGLTAAAQWTPTKLFAITAGVADANGSATLNRVERFFEDGELFTFVEAALLPTIAKLGAGKYRLAAWHRDSQKSTGRPSDYGWTLTLDQNVGEKRIAFARYGWSDARLTGISNSVQAGVAFEDAFVDRGVFGVAAAWADPSAAGQRNEKILEAFQRFQLTDVLQFTVGAQAIFDPSLAPDDHVLGVFSVRLRLAL
jgi:hypothetical protein